MKYFPLKCCWVFNDGIRSCHGLLYIILTSLGSYKWLVTPIYKPFRPFVRGTTRSLGEQPDPG